MKSNVGLGSIAAWSSITRIIATVRIRSTGRYMPHSLSMIQVPVTSIFLYL